MPDSVQYEARRGNYGAWVVVIRGSDWVVDAMNSREEANRTAAALNSPRKGGKGKGVTMSARGAT